MSYTKQRAKTEFAVQMYWPDEDAGTPENATESWYDTVPTNTVDFSQLGSVCVPRFHFHTRIYKLTIEQGAKDDETNPKSVSYAVDDS